MPTAPLSIVCIGGGTGMPQLLAGLKTLARERDPQTPVDLSTVVAIVSAFDDGGSSGRLMETYDTLPPGDLRNCLVALADEQVEPLMTRFLNHRFGEEDRSDPLAGHSVGNLLLLALAQVYDGDMRQALLNVGRILPIQSRILFPTLSPAVLCAELADGSVVRGESQIGGRDNPSPIDRIFLEPRPSTRSGPAEPVKQTGSFEVPPMEGVIEALDGADLIAMGPGSLFTSVLPHLLVEGVSEALRRNAERVVYVCNIMNEPGETDGYTAADFVAAIERHGGFTPGAVLVNDAQVSGDFYRAYSKERLALGFERLRRQLEGAFTDAVDGLESGSLRRMIPTFEAELWRLSDQIEKASVNQIQVLPPDRAAANLPQSRFIATDLMGTREVSERGRTKRVIRHDPVKLARALVSCAAS